jgi:hypothetical protein
MNKSASYNFKLGGLFTSDIDLTSQTQLNWVASNLDSVAFSPSAGIASAFQYIKQINPDVKKYIYLESGIAADIPTYNVGKYIGITSGMATSWKTNISNYPTTAIPAGQPSYTRYIDYSAWDYTDFWYTAANNIIGSSSADGIIINEPIWNRNFYVNGNAPTTILASAWYSLGQASYQNTNSFQGVNYYNNFIRYAGSYIPSYDVIIKSDTLLNLIDTTTGTSANTLLDVLDTYQLGIYSENTIFSNGTYNSLDNSEKLNSLTKSKNIYFNNYKPFVSSTNTLNYIIDNQILISNPTSNYYLQVGSHSLIDFINFIGSYPNQFNTNLENIKSETTKLTNSLYCKQFSNKDVYLNLGVATQTYAIPTGIAYREYIATKIINNLHLVPFSSEHLSVSTGIVVDYSNKYTITEFAQGLKTNVNEVMMEAKQHGHTDQGIAPDYINMASHTTGILDSSRIDSIDVSKVASIIVNWKQLPNIDHIGRVNEYCHIKRENLIPDVNSNYTQYNYTTSWSGSSIIVFKNGTPVTNYIAYPDQGYITFDEGFNTWADQITIAFDAKTWIANNGPWNSDAGIRVTVNNSDYTFQIVSKIPEEGKIVFSNNIDLHAYVKITIFNIVVKDIGSYSHYELEDKISNYDSYLTYETSNILQSNLLNNIVLSAPSARANTILNTKLYDMFSMYQDETDNNGPDDVVPGIVEIIPTVGTYSYVVGSIVLGQTFAANYNIINGVRTYLSRTGTYNYNINFKLYENSATGFPYTLLATTSIAATHIPTYGSWYDFIIPTQSITLNNMYSVTIDTTLASTANSKLDWYDNAAGYDFGNAIIWTGSWSALYDTDRCFDTIYNVPSVGRASGITGTGALGQVFISQTESLDRVGLRLNKDGTACYRIKLDVLDVNASRLPMPSVSFANIYTNSNYVSQSSTYVGYTEFNFDPPVKINSGKEYCFALSSESSSPTDIIYWNSSADITPLESFAIASGNNTWNLDTTKDRVKFYYPCDNDIQIPLFRFTAAEICMFRFNKVNKISLYLKRFVKDRENIAVSAVNYQLKVSICNLDISNQPSTELHSVTVDASTISNAGYYDFEFINAYVTPKKKYAVKIEQISGDIDNTVIVYAIDSLISNWNNTLVYVNSSWQPLNNASVKMISHCFENVETIDDANENYGIIPTYYAINASTSILQSFRHTAVSPTQMHLSIWMQKPTAIAFPTYLYSHILDLTAGAPDLTKILASGMSTLSGLSTYSFQPVDFYMNTATSISAGNYAFQVGYQTGTMIPSTSTFAGIVNTYNSNYNTYWADNTTVSSIPSYIVPFEMHSIGNFINDVGGSDNPIENGLETVVDTVAQTFQNSKTNITNLKVFLSKDEGQEFTFTVSLVNCDGSNLPNLNSILYTHTYHSLNVSTSGDYFAIDFSDYPIPVTINNYYAIIISKDTSASKLYWWKSFDYPLGISYTLINSIWTADDFDRSFEYSGQEEITNPNRKSLPSFIVANDLLGEWESASIVISILIDQSDSMLINDPTNLRYTAAINFIKSMHELLGSAVYFDVIIFTTKIWNTSPLELPYNYNIKDYISYTYVDKTYLGGISAILGESYNITNDSYILENYINYINTHMLADYSWWLTGNDVNSYSKGGTPLYLALNAALTRLNYESQAGVATNKQKAIVMFTDGVDSSTPYPNTDVIDYIESSKIPVYTIALATDSETDKIVQTRTFNAITTASNGKVFIIPDVEHLDDVFTYIKESGSWTYQDLIQIQDFEEDVEVTSLKVETIMNSTIHSYYTIEYRAESDTEWTSYLNGKNIYIDALSDADEIVNFIARYIKYTVHFNSGGSQND